MATTGTAALASEVKPLYVRGAKKKTSKKKRPSKKAGKKK